MLRHVATVPLTFQRFPITHGSPCDMAATWLRHGIRGNVDVRPRRAALVHGSTWPEGRENLNWEIKYDGRLASGK